MKTKCVRMFVLAGLLALFPGCVAFPPLIQIEHKEPPAPSMDQQILRRLDAIDRRLDAMEQPRPPLPPPQPPVAPPPPAPAPPQKP